jgi:hypothetical protein|tara:strand:+ start:5000 stop:5311 length:312 start_codon:yes stop_codon:yes gene_type:complete
MNEYDPDVRKKKQEGGKSKRDQELEDIRQVMATANGRGFILKLLEKSGVFNLSYSSNANETAFKEGRRSLGLSVYRDVAEAVPDGVRQLLGDFYVRRTGNHDS